MEAIKTRQAVREVISDLEAWEVDVLVTLFKRHANPGVQISDLQMRVLGRLASRLVERFDYVEVQNELSAWLRT